MQLSLTVNRKLSYFWLAAKSAIKAPNHNDLDDLQLFRNLAGIIDNKFKNDRKAFEEFSKFLPIQSTQERFSDLQHVLDVGGYANNALSTVLSPIVEQGLRYRTPVNYTAKEEADNAELARLAKLAREAITNTRKADSLNGTDSVTLSEFTNSFFRISDTNSNIRPRIFLVILEVSNIKGREWLKYGIADRLNEQMRYSAGGERSELSKLSYEKLRRLGTLLQSYAGEGSKENAALLFNIATEKEHSEKETLKSNVNPEYKEKQ